jgi:acetyl esterase/lipase
MKEGRLYLSGHSAGAHLAALLATDPSYLGKYNIPTTIFGGVIPVDTASFDLLSETNENFVKDLVKVNFGTDPESLRRASPIHWVKDNENYSPFLILASANRMPVVTQGKILVDKLQSAGSIAFFEAIDDHNHRKMNVGMYTEGDPVSTAILKFISP